MPRSNARRGAQAIEKEMKAHIWPIGSFDGSAPRGSKDVAQRLRLDAKSGRRAGPHSQSRFGEEIGSIQDPLHRRIKLAPEVQQLTASASGAARAGAATTGIAATLAAVPA